ncbi:MAG: four helix bundle protein [Bacteroidaceae bacterium]|nr:four helix bundle protein [Bacteroidaceae bacterium]
MKENNSIVASKSKAFALRIIKLYKYLTLEKKEFVISKQILRSGTSIGANISEALSGISTNDFYAKIYISFKESSETKYWLELLHESDYINDEQFNSIYADCVELNKLLSSITKSIKEKIINNKLRKEQGLDDADPA